MLQLDYSGRLHLDIEVQVIEKGYWNLETVIT